MNDKSEPLRCLNCLKEFKSKVLLVDHINTMKYAKKRSKDVCKDTHYCLVCNLDVHDIKVHRRFKEHIASLPFFLNEDINGVNYSDLDLIRNFNEVPLSLNLQANWGKSFFKNILRDTYFNNSKENHSIYCYNGKYFIKENGAWIKSDLTYIKKFIQDSLREIIGNLNERCFKVYDLKEIIKEENFIKDQTFEVFQQFNYLNDYYFASFSPKAFPYTELVNFLKKQTKDAQKAAKMKQKQQRESSESGDESSRKEEGSSEKGEEGSGSEKEEGSGDESSREEEGSSGSGDESSRSEKEEGSGEVSKKGEGEENSGDSEVLEIIEEGSEESSVEGNNENSEVLENNENSEVLEVNEGNSEVLEVNKNFDKGKGISTPENLEEYSGENIESEGNGIYYDLPPRFENFSEESEEENIGGVRINEDLMVSLNDIIKICSASSDPVTKAKQILKNNDIQNIKFKFKGKNQRDTLVISIEDAVFIVLNCFEGEKVEQFKENYLEKLVNCCEGDISLLHKKKPFKFIGEFLGREDEIRITPDNKVSVLDVIRVVGEQIDASCVLRRLLKNNYIKERLIGHLTMHKFLDGKSSYTIDARGLIKLLNYIPGKTARRFFEKSAEILVRYLGGDETLIKEIKDINENHLKNPNNPNKFFRDEVNRNNES